MQITGTVAECRAALETLRSGGRRVGFVPTMGALHEGHLSLLRHARQENDVVAASIFVNPTQFAPGEDFEKYPRPLDRDLRLSKAAGVDLIFAPDAAAMYRKESLTSVTIDRLSGKLCGASRPTHFRGVLTVVAKLFNIVAPDRAYFGQKDAQQAILIMRMVEELNFPVTVRVCPTVREDDGLAVSSRNEYLSEDERRQAACLHRALSRAEELFEKGDRRAFPIVEESTKIIGEASLAKIDYFRVVDPSTLEDIDVVEDCALVAGAVFMGGTRLIDNIFLGTRPFSGSVPGSK